MFGRIAWVPARKEPWMTANLKRALAVGLTATLAFIALLTVPAHSAPTPTPSSSSAPASSSDSTADTTSSSASATSAGTTSSSASATAAGTISSISSTSTGSGARVTAAATTDPAPVLRAATYLSKNLPTLDAGTGTFVAEALALSAARSCDYSSTIAALLASITSQAADYVGNDPARAANLAIAAIALGEDPTSFGGLNLMSIIAAGTHTDGQVGGYASSYSQSLAVIAYVRAGQPVPDPVLANLVGGQDSLGAFGYSDGGTFYPDYDTTGLAIEALSAAHGDSAVINKAIAWALAQQNVTGYWPNAYSPVDSTGILGSGLEFAGTSSGGAAAWLRSVQLGDGGFPAALGETTSNIMATSDAMWLIAGSNLVTVSMLQCPASTTDPAASVAASVGATSLADTGSPDDGPIGALAVSMLVVGAGALAVGRRKRQA